MNGLKKNFLLTSAYQLVYVLAPLLTTPYISRILGAEGVGDYAFAFSIANYFALFIRLGVLTYGNRTIAASRDDKKEMSKVFWQIFSLQFFCGIILSIAYIFWAFALSPRADLSVCFALMVFSASIDITWLLYGVEDFFVTTLRDIFIKISTVLFIFLVVKNKDDLWKYTLIQAAGYFGAQLLAWLRINYHVSYEKPTLHGILKHLKPNLVLFIPTIAVSIYKIMDKVMLGAMTSSAELGYYESSEKVIGVPMALITSLGIVMLPRMSNLFASEQDEEIIKLVIYKSLRFSTFISTLLCFGIASVADIFVPLFYGSGYDRCVDIYAWLLPSCVFLSFAQVIKTQFLMPKKRDKEFILSCFGGAVINLVLNVLLIPIFASVGASIATLAAEASVCLIQCWFIRKEINIKRAILNCAPFICAGMVMFFCIKTEYITAGGQLSSLLLKILLCSAVYFAVIAFVWLVHCIALKCNNMRIMT